MITVEEILNGEGVLIAAHRGCSGGNIIENTIKAFEVALMHGSHIIEADIATTADDVPVLIHDGMEGRLLTKPANVKQMTYAEIGALRYRNSNSAEIGQPIEKLDTVLEHFKGRAVINLDRCWDSMDIVLRTVERHNMLDQVIIKSPVVKKYIQVIEEMEKPFCYMPIVKTITELEQACTSRLNIIAAELIFENDDSPLLAPDILEKLKRRNIQLWANAINLNDYKRLSAGHDDYTSLFVDPDNGWGWLIDKGFRIIQTDWPGLLASFLKQRAM